MYWLQFKLERECPYYQPTQCHFTKYFYFQCYLVIIETLCITKSVINGIVLVKNVKIVFTLKQIYFSFPAQTAVWPRSLLLPPLLNLLKIGNFQYFLTWSFLVRFDFFTAFLESSKRALSFRKHSRPHFTMTNGLFVEL